MKKYYSIIALVILLLTTSLLFWRGESGLKKASQNFVMFYFENTDLSISKTDKKAIAQGVAFSIENKKQEPVQYEITHFIDNQKIFSETIEIKKNETKQISPSDELISAIEEAKGESFLYQIRTNYENEGEFKLTKKIFFR